MLRFVLAWLIAVGASAAGRGDDPRAYVPSPGSGYLLALPAAGTTIPTNARLLLQGVGSYQAKLVALGALNPQLESTGDAVPLDASSVSGLEPGSRWVEVLLVPRRQLQPGGKYRLTVEAAGRRVPMQTQRFEGPDGARIEYVDLEWRVGGSSDTTPPVWKALPVQDDAFQKDGGDLPPDSHFCSSKSRIRGEIAVRVDASDESALYVKATIRRKDGSLVVDGYLPLIRGQVVLRGLCPRDFGGPLDANKTYWVTLTVIDAAGNASIPQKEVAVRWKFDWSQVGPPL